MHTAKRSDIKQIGLFFLTGLLLYLAELRLTEEAQSQGFPIVALTLFFSLLVGAQSYLLRATQGAQTGSLLAMHALRFIATIFLFLIYAFLVKTSLKLFAINLMVFYAVSLLLSVVSALNTRTKTKHKNK